jgi:hypothetical protein
MKADRLAWQLAENVASCRSLGRRDATAPRYGDVRGWRAKKGRRVSDLRTARVGSQAGLVMRNAGLTEDLLDTIEQLRASRQRLVSTQDEDAGSSSGTCTTAPNSRSSR